MRIHYLQHVAFEGLGFIEDWAKQRHYPITVTRFFENNPLPEMDAFDFLIVLGGSMGTHDERQHMWLKAEKDFLRKAIDTDKKILGICLGAQLLAAVLGAKVYPNKQKEIGWFPVIKINKTASLLSDFPNEFTVFHWHGDAFEIPENAVNLFSSESCKNQAFLYKESVLGLQFHLEVSSNSVTTMIENGRNELVEEKYIQSENNIKAKTEWFKFNKAILYQILDYLVTKP